MTIEKKILLVQYNSYYYYLIITYYSQTVIYRVFHLHVYNMYIICIHSKRAGKWMLIPTNNGIYRYIAIWRFP